MADMPHGTFALGVFCQLVQPYLTQFTRTKAGFMKDFFDSIIDTERLEKDPSPHEKIPRTGPTSITAGVWRGTNSKDLAKFYNGVRKLPSWKASRFLKHLDESKVDIFFTEISIDALGDLQKRLSDIGITVATVNKLPNAVTKWLKAILEANARGDDLFANGIALQPELDLFEGIPLAEGRISAGKLHLGRSSLPWKPAPPVPKDLDLDLEAWYTSQLYAAFAEHLKKPIESSEALPPRYMVEFDEQRSHFYSAEGVRRNLRDVVEGGENEFSALKEDLYDEVSDICASEHTDALARMRSTLAQAVNYQLTGSVVIKFPSMIKGTHRKGICHMLVNDRRLEWVRSEDE